jgi:hypothetical protein
VGIVAAAGQRREDVDDVSGLESLVVLHVTAVDEHDPRHVSGDREALDEAMHGRPGLELDHAGAVTTSRGKEARQHREEPDFDLHEPEG